MSDQLQLGTVLIVAVCCVWPVVAYFILSLLGRIWRGLGVMLDRLIHRSRYQ